MSTPVNTGRLEEGFVRVACAAGRHERLVGCSRKGRGFCAACGVRRMVESAVGLVGRVFPHVPTRQWYFALAAARAAPPDWTDAERWFAPAANLAGRRAERPLLAKIHYRWAEAQGARGRLVEARAAFEAMRMGWWVCCTDELAARPDAGESGA